MKKIKGIIKNNVKTIVAFIIGGLMFGTGVYAVVESIPSKSVTYTKNGQSTVEGALDTLYSKALNCQNIKNNTVYFNFGNPTSSNTQNYSSLNKKVFAALNGDQRSICIIRNNRLHCFDNNNWTIEKEHMQHVFSDVSCLTTSIPGYGTFMECTASDFQCTIHTTGGAIHCTDKGTSEYCELGQDNFATCGNK